MAPDRIRFLAPHAVIGDGITPAVVDVTAGTITAIRTGPGAQSLIEAGTEQPAAEPAFDTFHLLSEQEVLLPGFVDTHVHINEPGRTDWEGFTSATRAAAAGGITTLIDMPLNCSPVTTTPAALDAKLAVTDGKLSVSTGFWGGAVPDNLGHLRALWERGVFGFKCFTADSGIDEFRPLTPAQMRQAMVEIADFDGLLIIHAEHSDTLRAAPPATGPEYHDYLDSRPESAEDIAIAQIIDAVRETGCRTHILHLSSAGALPRLRRAKEEGLPITVETCPHYLSLFAEEIRDGATAHKCAPPIRTAANREALWAGLRDGTIDIVVSDHSPCTPELKKLASGDFGTAWGGIASVQLGLSIVWTQARLRGFTLADVARWMSGSPARFIGATDRGQIRTGARADLVIFAPDEAFVVHPELLLHKNPVSAYAERALAGVVHRTFLGGAPIDLQDPRPHAETLFRAPAADLPDHHAEPAQERTYRADHR